MVGMAQLASAPDCGSGGRGFESLYPPFFFIAHISDAIGLSPSGKAQDFDSCIRWFGNPASPVIKVQTYGPLAQAVEHLTF